MKNTNNKNYNLKSKLFFIFHFSFLIFILFLTMPHVQAQVATPGPSQKNVSVSAIVPPKASDFQFTFRYEGSSLVSQDQSITYEIIYGASSSAGLTTNNTIVVNYSDNKAPDKSYLVEYIIGSATKGYGGVQPVIDTLNRTITWRLASLPEGTMDQKVSFQLRANGNTHDMKRLTFSSRASLSNEYLSLPTQGLNQDYLFDPLRVTPGPTATPGPRANPTPTPAALQFIDVSLNSLSQSSAEIAVAANNPVRASIAYGTSPTTLTQRSTLTALRNYNLIKIDNLTPSTIYYYQVIITDASGKSIRSDIMTFVTAQQSDATFTGKDAYIVTSGDTVLLSNVLEETTDFSSFFLLPNNTGYKLTYTFNAAPSLKRLEAIVRNDNGIVQRVQMTAEDLRTYTAQLRTNNIGSYSVDLLQYDADGNIIGRRLANMKVSPRFKVLNAQSSSPISDARVSLQKFNPITKQFEVFENATVKNPSFTDLQGEVTMIFNAGSYRVTVGAFGFKEKSVDFTIGPEDGSGYPTVFLEQDLFNTGALFSNIKTLFLDTFAFLVELLRAFSQSIRAFAVVSAIALTSFVALGFLLFNIRTDIRWRDLIPFFLFRIAVARGKHAEMYLFGIVVDKDGKLLSDIRLEFSHVKSGVILAHTVSNQSGGFRISNTFKEPYVKLTASRDGIPPVTMIIPTDTRNAITVRMQESKTLPSLIKGIKHFSGGFFEVILILSLIMELLFIDAFGVVRTLPFILITFFNLALWIFYQKERGIHKLH
jgi:hypothetical protein